MLVLWLLQEWLFYRGTFYPFEDPRFVYEVKEEAATKSTAFL